MTGSVIEVIDEADLLRKTSELESGIVLIRKAFSAYKYLRLRGSPWLNFYVYPTSSAPNDTVTEAVFILLQERKKLGSPPSRLNREKAVSRRDLFNPFSSLKEYINGPVVGKKGVHLLKDTKELLAQICPYNALKESIENLLEQKCTECGLCYSFLPIEILESPLIPFNGIKRMLEYLSEKNSPALYLYFDINREEEVYKAVISRERPFIVIPVTGISVPWWLPLLHYVYKKPAALIANKSKYLNYVIKDLERLGIHDFLRVYEDINMLDTFEKQNPSEAFPMESNSSNLIVNVISSLVYESKDIKTFVPGAIRSFTPIVDENRCILCGACVRACIYDALAMESEPKTPRLLIKLNACQGCYNCLYVCPTTSIKTFEPQLSYNGWGTLVQDELIKCIYCDTPVGPRRKIEYTERKLAESLEPDKIKEVTRVCAICRMKSLNQT